MTCPILVSSSYNARLAVVVTDKLNDDLSWLKIWSFLGGKHQVRVLDKSCCWELRNLWNLCEASVEKHETPPLCPNKMYIFLLTDYPWCIRSSFRTYINGREGSVKNRYLLWIILSEKMVVYKYLAFEMYDTYRASILSLSSIPT